MTIVIIYSNYALTKTAVQANIVVIACIVLSTDSSSHFVFFCLGTSPIKNRLPVDMTSLAKFKFFQYPGLLLEKALAVLNDWIRCCYPYTLQL